jgi:hypothetical protein
LDRLDAGEAQHYGHFRSKVMGVVPPKPIGAQDNRDIFSFGPTPTEMTSPPPITLNEWIHKYTSRVVEAAVATNQPKDHGSGGGSSCSGGDDKISDEKDGGTNTTTMEQDKTTTAAAAAATLLPSSTDAVTPLNTSIITTTSVGSRRQNSPFTTATAIALEQRTRRRSLSQTILSPDASMDISMSSSSFSFSSPLSRTG